MDQTTTWLLLFSDLMNSRGVIFFWFVILLKIVAACCCCLFVSCFVEVVVFGFVRGMGLLALVLHALGCFCLGSALSRCACSWWLQKSTAQVIIPNPDSSRDLQKKLHVQPDHTRTQERFQLVGKDNTNSWSRAFMLAGPTGTTYS